MDSRREFLKKAALLSGGAGVMTLFPESIRKAMAISPAPGSTYLDAEHVVILMQENRSFDHTYGRLQGVRGYNDPRAISLPDQNKVWLQTDEKGDTYAPFRLDIKNTKATWMHDLPHSRESQVDAYNGGKFDKWLLSKKSSRKEYAHMPLTLGYYDREDIPFYYAFADAFTICDQNFCSSMTPTHPNRYYLWSGTIREKPDMESLAVVRNSYFSVDNPVKWKSFPERLEEAGVSWNFYQNEISAVMRYNTKVGSWLGNFGCNPLERFAQYNAKYSSAYVHFVGVELEKLKSTLAEAERKAAEATGEAKAKLTTALNAQKALIEKYESELKQYTEDNFRKLSPVEKGIHQRAFVTNHQDPDYLKVSRISYEDGGERRNVEVPKSDIFYQFRKDVKEGKLPAVSYLAAPQNFSDHPSAPWYGAWYVSEVLDILTHDPEVWKKTIFILCYDENDGYYDHQPPFSIPHPFKEHAGKVSSGIDIKAEWVSLEQDQTQVPKANAREGAIGLGFRVPLVVASPWSRGGKVCSQVFDHTSILQFLEEFTSHKSKKTVRESNITEWRRTICGNISSVFQPFDPSAYRKPQPVDRDQIIETIHKAQFKEVPSNFRALTKQEIENINRDNAQGLLPQQESGTRPACAIPYELYADGHLGKDRKSFQINFASGKKAFGAQSAGAPFIVYASAPYENEQLRVWNYGVKAGDSIEDSWKLDGFGQDGYHLKVYGPNGFFREFAGNAQDPDLDVQAQYVFGKNGKPTGDLQLHIVNLSGKAHALKITDNAYHQKPLSVSVDAGKSKDVVVSLKSSDQWYDLSISTAGSTMIKRYAGHVETGRESRTDPFMGRTV